MAFIVARPAQLQTKWKHCVGPAGANPGTVRIAQLALARRLHGTIHGLRAIRRRGFVRAR